MNTLFSDSLSLLYKHFDVLPTVFLSDNQIELEDREEKIFQQHNWPWILYELKRDPNLSMQWFVKYHRELNILSYIKYDKNFVHREAHKYNFQELMTEHGRDVHCILNAAVNGHVELFLKLLPDFYMDNESLKLYLIGAIFQSPITREAMIHSIEFGQDIQRNTYQKYRGTIMADDLDYLLKLIESGFMNEPCAIIGHVSKKTYKTVKYLIDNHLVNIQSAGFALLREVIRNGSVELFNFIFNKIEIKTSEYSELYMDCLFSNRWDIIDIILSKLSPLSRSAHMCIFQSLINLPEHALKNGHRKTLYKLWCL